MVVYVEDEQQKALWVTLQTSTLKCGSATGSCQLLLFVPLQDTPAGLLLGLVQHGIKIR